MVGFDSSAESGLCQRQIAVRNPTQTTAARQKAKLQKYIKKITTFAFSVKGGENMCFSLCRYKKKKINSDSQRTLIKVTFSELYKNNKCRDEKSRSYHQGDKGRLIVAAV